MDFPVYFLSSVFTIFSVVLLNLKMLTDMGEESPMFVFHPKIQLSKWQRKGLYTK